MSVNSSNIVTASVGRRNSLFPIRYPINFYHSEYQWKKKKKGTRLYVSSFAAIEHLLKFGSKELIFAGGAAVHHVLKISCAYNIITESNAIPQLIYSHEGPETSFDTV